MKKPEMIIFDYGHTLLYQPNFSTSNGNKAIYPYINRNPHNISFEQYDKTITELFAKIKAERGAILEIHEHNFLKLAMEYMDISFSVSIQEAEEIIMNGISEGGIMPYADIMLDYLNSKGIRTGVISNNCFSGNALKKLFDRLLPRNKFEFILTSSDYIFRKPNRVMFDIALQKAGLSADKVWYCGDSIEADVRGSKNVGMFPVLYEGATVDGTNPFAHQNDDLKVDFEYLHITDWKKLIDVLEHCEEHCMFEEISFPAHEYESIQNYLNQLGYCYTTRVYKEIGKYKVGEFYIAPWGDVLKIDEVKTYRKVSDRPFYDEMSDDEKIEIRKYSEEIGLPYEFIRFSRSTV